MFVYTEMERLASFGSWVECLFVGEQGSKNEVGPPNPSARPEVLPTSDPESLARSIERAVAILRQGGLVAIPTETVYGLAANAWDPVAVERIFQAKQRPATNPIIVHVASISLALQCVQSWPDRAERLAQAFWPGPLTMVLPRNKRIPSVVTAGGPTVGIRWPRQPVTEAIIQKCGFPLAAPSANPSTAVSPTRAEHVLRALGDRIDAIVDGGPCPVGIESTVVDLTTDPVTILRPGMIDPESIAAVLGEEVRIKSLHPAEEIAEASAVARSPGQMPRHYAPRARVFLWKWEDAEALAERLRQEGIEPERTVVLALQQWPGRWRPLRWIVMPAEPKAYAARLYALFHESDEAGAQAIVVEPPPEGPEWLALHDRLHRAAKEG